MLVLYLFLLIVLGFFSSSVRRNILTSVRYYFFNVLFFPQDNVVVLNSIILSVQKCMDNFGGFLNPYYKTFVVATCRLMKINDDSDVDEDRKSQATKNRLRHLCATISRSVPTHKLIDIASQCYDELSADTASSQSVIALSTILRENLAQLVIIFFFRAEAVMDVHRGG